MGNFSLEILHRNELFALRLLEAEIKRVASKEFDCGKKKHHSDWLFLRIESKDVPEILLAREVQFDGEIKIHSNSSGTLHCKLVAVCHVYVRHGVRILGAAVGNISYYIHDHTEAKNTVKLWP